MTDDIFFTRRKKKMVSLRLDTHEWLSEMSQSTHLSQGEIVDTLIAALYQTYIATVKAGEDPAGILGHLKRKILSKY